MLSQVEVTPVSFISLPQVGQGGEIGGTVFEDRSDVGMNVALPETLGATVAVWCRVGS
jgi:hypothetical protein